MMKKMLSLLLSVLLVLTLTVPALAYDTNTGAEQAEALKELGLFAGTGDGFELNREATRAEAIVMIIRFMGKEAEAKATPAKSPFTDVPAWAGSYVAYAYENGITTGISKTAFGAEQPITAQQFVTMMLRVLGYDGVSYDNAVSFGKRIGMLSDNVNVNEFYRGDMVDICCSTLNIKANGSEQTVAEDLIESGVFTKAQYDAAMDGIADEKDDAAVADGLVIYEQGMFSAGGTVTEPVEGEYDPTTNWLDSSRAGNTAHVDHANVLYQIPASETGNPMVFLHGYGQSRMGWMTTPDGRDGWSTMFLEKGHSVFLVDQPRRGEAGSTVSMTADGFLDAWAADSKDYKPGDQAWYTHFRIGRVAPERYDGSQFPAGAEAQDQFFRQMTPNTGSLDMGVAADAMEVVMEEAYGMTGKKAVFVTHSQGGAIGWNVDVENIAAIVAIEPGGAPQVGSAQYQALLEADIPIVFYFGDYIDNGPEDIMSTGFWKGIRDGAVAFAQQYNADGGDCTVVNLPDVGIIGNSHFMFQELNNQEIADHVAAWMAERGLN